jgi:hypothetical protein
MSIDCVVLGEDQQLELSRIAQSRSLPAGYVFRSRLILMLAEGASFSTIKAEVSAVSVVLHPGTNCISPDTSRMVLDAPSNQGAHQGKRAAETQAQQYDEQPEGLEPRMAGIDSVR